MQKTHSYAVIVVTGSCAGSEATLTASASAASYAAAYALYTASISAFVAQARLAAFARLRRACWHL